MFAKNISIRLVGSRGAEDEVECGIGNVAAVWDGEVAGMAGALARARREKKVLILADSKAAIAAVRKAGRTGKRGLDTCERWLTRLRRSKREGGKLN